jgi:hypothetical protein
MLRAYYNARFLFPRSRVLVEETGKGYHVKIFRRLSRLDNMRARAILGDDPERLAWDEEKYRRRLFNFIDTLFEVKRGRDGETRRVIEINPLSEQFWRLTPQEVRCLE